MNQVPLLQSTVISKYFPQKLKNVGPRKVRSPLLQHFGLYKSGVLDKSSAIYSICPKDYAYPYKNIPWCPMLSCTSVCHNSLLSCYFSFLSSFLCYHLVLLLTCSFSIDDNQSIILELHLIQTGKHLVSFARIFYFFFALKHKYRYIYQLVPFHCHNPPPSPFFLCSPPLYLIIHMLYDSLSSSLLLG